MDASLRSADWLGRVVDVEIDRPLGSSHPREAAMVYPVNYGFVPGTRAPDGQPLDVYVLGAPEPLATCAGPVVAIIRRRDDIEDKLVVALTGKWDGETIAEAVAFQERWFDSYVELPPPGPAGLTDQPDGPHTE
jgi:inorganic pyrophosphatase